MNFFIIWITLWLFSTYCTFKAKNLRIQNNYIFHAYLSMSKYLYENNVQIFWINKQEPSWRADVPFSPKSNYFPKRISTSHREPYVNPQVDPSCPILSWARTSQRGVREAKKGAHLSDIYYRRKSNAVDSTLSLVVVVAPERIINWARTSPK